jgi:hypothetical protein
MFKSESRQNRVIQIVPVSEPCDSRHRVSGSGEEGDEAEELKGVDVGDDRRDVVHQTFDVAHHSFRQKIG